MKKLALVLPLALACGCGDSPPDVSDAARRVAEVEIARLNLQISGSPVGGETDVPAQLTDGNYGPKAQACHDGGYDLSSVAGLHVTFVGYHVTCVSSLVGMVWVVVHDDTAACAYLSAPDDGRGIGGGIYAVSACNP